MKDSQRVFAFLIFSLIFNFNHFVTLGQPSNWTIDLVSEPFLSHFPFLFNSILTFIKLPNPLLLKSHLHSLEPISRWDATF